MKLIDTYNNYKIKYKEYVVLVKSGIFYECFNDDIGIMYSLFSYKIKNNGSNYVVGFPNNSLSKVLNVLEENKINYIVVEDNNIVDKYKTNKNRYLEYVTDLNKLIYINMKIDSIYKKLQSNILNNDIEKILLKIEDILWMISY